MKSMFEEEIIELREVARTIARIAAALAAAPAGEAEPVAWEYRDLRASEPRWEACSDIAAFDYRQLPRDYEVRALYLAPTPAAGADALIDLLGDALVKASAPAPQEGEG